MKSTIAWILSIGALVLSSPVFASQTCNSSGAAPLFCQSPDGKYAFEITATENNGNGISKDSFCTRSYLKLDGHEVNGARGEEVGDAGLSSVDAQTSKEGIPMGNPATHLKIWPLTAVTYVLRRPVDGADRGYIFVFHPEKDPSDNATMQMATIYMYSGNQIKGYRYLFCK